MINAYNKHVNERLLYMIVNECILIVYYVYSVLYIVWIHLCVHRWLKQQHDSLVRGEHPGSKMQFSRHN